MAAWRRRSACLFACLGVLVLATGCVNLLDPLGKEDDFRRMQKRFNPYRSQTSPCNKATM